MTTCHLTDAQQCHMTPKKIAEIVDGFRYGKRRVLKMYQQINNLRRAIRQEGSEAIQDAWDEVEEHIDFAFMGDGVEGLIDRLSKKHGVPVESVRSVYVRMVTMQGAV